MPWLYSPLYQSIRLILFGALGLTSLTVSAALNPVDNNVDAQTTEPLITENSSDAALSTLSTERANQTQNGAADANNKALNSQLTTAPVFNNNNVFTNDNVNITAINDSSDGININNHGNSPKISQAPLPIYTKVTELPTLLKIAESIGLNVTPAAGTKVVKVPIAPAVFLIITAVPIDFSSTGLDTVIT